MRNLSRQNLATIQQFSRVYCPNTALILNSSARAILGLPSTAPPNAWVDCLVSVYQSRRTWPEYADSAVRTNQVVARAIIPRIPPNTLLPFAQLVRPTFSLVTVPAPAGGTRTDFGDMQLFDLAVLPWPSAETGLRFGLGPTFVFPTATSKFAGQGAWQAGPACAAVYTGVPRLLIGFLLQNPISFAYTSPDRPSQNTLALEPAVLFSLWDGWYLRSADATWVYGWRRHSPSLLPLSLGVGRVMVRPGLPPLNFYVAAQWMAYHQNSPIVSQWSVNFGVTIAFPWLGRGE